MFQEWRQQTVPSLLAYGAFSWPDSIAIYYQEQQITYLELYKRTKNVRNALIKLGISEGDHVSYLMSSSPRWLEIFFACLDIGATLVPLNLTWTQNELVQGIQLTDSTTLLVGSEHKGISLLEKVSLMVDELNDKNSVLKNILIVEKSDEASSQSRFKVLDDYIEDLDIDLEEPIINDANKSKKQAMLILTSGSTSFPKPAIHTHESILCGSSGFADGIEATKDDIFFHCMPNYHVGSIATACLMLMRGGALRIVRYFEPKEALDLIQSDKASLFWGFDTLLLMMAEQSNFDPKKLSSLKRTMIAANPATFDKIRKMGLDHIGNIYGSTEYMGSQTYFPYRDRFDYRRMRESNGRAMSGEVVVIDLVNGEVCSPGQMGEICVRGPALFKGYYNMPKEYEACIDKNGFFHSGDLGYMDESGYVYYRGRLKETIKTGGENVSSLEVESFLLAKVPGIARVLVCATPHDKWIEAVTALIQKVPGSDLTEEEVKQMCRGKIANYKIPKRVLFLGEENWQITPTGKLNRQSLINIAIQKFESDN